MAYKVKVAYEIKVQIVRQVFDENLSLAEAAKKAGVNVMVVKDWIRIYQNEGITGLLPKDGNNVYSATLKMSAVPGVCSAILVSSHPWRSITCSLLHKKRTAVVLLSGKILYFFTVLLTGCGSHAEGLIICMHTIHLNNIVFRPRAGGSFAPMAKTGGANQQG